MKRIMFFAIGLFVSQVAWSQQTISSLSEFIALQDANNQNIKMAPGTYHISSASKSLFPGGEWRVSREGNWPGLFKFTGRNNTYDLTGVKFTFDSTIIGEMPSLAHGRLVELGGSGNVWKGFDLEELPRNGDYGLFRHTSGGSILTITGSGHEFYDTTLKSRFSQPYGFGSLYGKTGSAAGRLPGSALNKKSGFSIDELSDTYFENTFVDHSALGHALVLYGPIEDVKFDTVSVIADTRSTNDIISNGVDGSDRNGVPFHVLYEGDSMTGAAGKTDFFNQFDTSNLNRCQNLGSGSQNGPMRPDYQFSLVEGAFRGYNQEEIKGLEIYNAYVEGTRSGIALDFAGDGITVDNMRVVGVAGHGVPSCGGWNGDNGGEGDATAFAPPSGSVIKNAQADAAYATILEFGGDRTNIEVDIEVLDPQNGYTRPSASTALALLSGKDHKIRIWKRDNEALTNNLVIKVGNDTSSNILLCNMTKQPVSISNKVTNSTIYSVGTVSNSGNSSNRVVTLNSASDEPSVCSDLGSEVRPEPSPAPTPTPTPEPTASGNFVSMMKSNNTSFAIDGDSGAANGQNVYLWSYTSRNQNQHWEEISRGGDFYSYKKRGTNHCLDGGRGGENRQTVYLWECMSNNQNQHWKKISIGNNFRLEKRNAPDYSIDGSRNGSNGQDVYLWESSNSNQNQQWQFESK